MISRNRDYVCCIYPVGEALLLTIFIRAKCTCTNVGLGGCFLIQN